ncbi:PLD nuclease N-terminal domain-containing protein [Rathayibacter festucae]|uniref:PLD nuclease N-terminal domain-containing protein n=1 Tax=Rathayibacter festucae TaxID=110937 RepID=UPI002A69A094|nr:PLD nuclease N-terminal domain-containing protein [Rathayibacter festucae]MDY0911560.1 PLD nuclease N-terminal domain-containing protein [Rathayibacter festucae]
MGFLFSLLTIVLMVLALVDVVRQPDNVVRNLPKIVWILLIVFIPLIGVTIWFLLGHDWKKGEGASFVPGGRTKRPRRSKTPPPPTMIVRPPTKSTEEQLADLEREEAHYARLAEEQRRLREGERPQDA